MIVVDKILTLWKGSLWLVCEYIVATHAGAGHRVLLFMQTRQMLKIFQEYIKSKVWQAFFNVRIGMSNNAQGYSFLILDGSVAMNQRQTLIHQFNHDTSIFLFLLTTRYEI